MKYDKNAISNTARKLRSKSSGLGSIQTKLSRVLPKKCSSSFYAKRSLLIRRLSNVQSEINSLSNDISSAANKMSFDDVQNARYIRQVFNNRTSKITFGQRLFSVGNSTLSRSGVFGNTLLFSQTALNRRPVSSLGNASLATTPWYKKVGNFFQSGAASLGKTLGEFGTKAWNGASNFFSNAGKWGAERLNDIKDWGKSATDYVWKSVTKFVLGDYSDDNITVLSFVGNIITGIFDVDLPLDVRDIVYDVQHWGEGENFGIYFALDVVALLPVIGVIKYCKYADDIVDGAKDLGKVIDAGADTGKTIDNITDAVDDAKDLGKNIDAVIDAGKVADNTADTSDVSKNLGKVAEEADIIISKNTDISADMEKKILEGKRVKETSNRIIGGHSPNITDGNPDYVVEVIKKNADGTSEIQYIKQFEDGNLSSIKKSTIFPDSWSDSKIIESVKKVGSTDPIGYRSRDGATLYRTIIDGVEIEVIKIGEKVTSAYPTGGGAKSLVSGFAEFMN